MIFNKSYNTLKLIQKNILYIVLLLSISIGILYYLNSNNKYINKYQIVIKNSQIFNDNFFNYLNILKLKSIHYDLFFTDSYFMFKNDKSQLNSDRTIRISLMENFADNLDRQLKLYESETKKNSNLVFSNISRFQSNYEDLGLIKLNIYSNSPSIMIKELNSYILNYEEFVKKILLKDLENNYNYINQNLKFNIHTLESLENNNNDNESNYMQEIVKQQTAEVIKNTVKLKDIESFKLDLNNYLVNKNTIFKSVNDYKIVGKRYEYNIKSLAIYLLFFSILFPIVISVSFGFLIKTLRK